MYIIEKKILKYENILKKPRGKGLFQEAQRGKGGNG
jgi:hypothetical protein